MEEKKLGLRNVISISVGLVIATSCLVSLGGSDQSENRAWLESTEDQLRRIVCTDGGA